MKGIELIAFVAFAACAAAIAVGLAFGEKPEQVQVQEHRLSDGTRCAVTASGMDCDWEGICDGHGVVQD